MTHRWLTLQPPHQPPPPLPPLRRPQPRRRCYWSKNIAYLRPTLPLRSRMASHTRGEALTSQCARVPFRPSASRASCSRWAARWHMHEVSSWSSTWRFSPTAFSTARRKHHRHDPIRRYENSAVDQHNYGARHGGSHGTEQALQVCR